VPHRYNRQNNPTYCSSCCPLQCHPSLSSIVLIAVIMGPLLVTNTIFNVIWLPSSTGLLMLLPPHDDPLELLVLKLLDRPHLLPIPVFSQQLNSLLLRIDLVLLFGHPQPGPLVRQLRVVQFSSRRHDCFLLRGLPHVTGQRARSALCRASFWKGGDPCVHMNIVTGYWSRWLLVASWRHINFLLFQLTFQVVVVFVGLDVFGLEVTLLCIYFRMPNDNNSFSN
jgi:hypothetical protein